MLTPVILSGGAGTRLWPLSRELYPKQLLPLIGPRTMLQQTVLRLEGLEASPPVIVCNEAHRFLVAEQLRQLKIEPRAHRARALRAQHRPGHRARGAGGAQAGADANAVDPVLLVLPADHVIRDVAAFQRARAHRRSPAAQHGQLVTFGIVPTAAGDRLRLHPARRRERRGVPHRALRREAGRAARARLRRFRRVLLEQRHVPVPRAALSRGAGAAAHRRWRASARRRFAARRADLEFTRIDRAGRSKPARRLDRLRRDGEDRATRWWCRSRPAGATSAPGRRCTRRATPTRTAT